MAKANPTLLGAAKNQYIEGGGERHTFVRCAKCNSKYVAEENPNGCPEECRKKESEAVNT